MHQVRQRNCSSRAIPGGTGGVTAVELVVGLVIAAILAAIALPLFWVIPIIAVSGRRNLSTKMRQWVCEFSVAAAPPLWLRPIRSGRAATAW